MRGAHPERALEDEIAHGGAMRSGERVAIACSGGADSVALAGALHALAEPLDLTLSLVHVNHGVRASAWQDECIALQLAASLGLPIEIVALEALGRDEQSLRDARYAALLAAAQRFQASAVATAHHAEDQSETVLLALFRGAGPEGISGIRARRPMASGVDLVRPLLGVASDTLRQYCHARWLPYSVDPTNADLGLRRNAVRDALEALRPLFPGLDRAVARASRLVDEEVVAGERADVRRRIRERLAAEQGLRDVDFQHVEAAVRAIERGASGNFYMKAGVRLQIERGAIAGITEE
jgi:tRNA(Ile)-lysidine synthase